MIEYHLNRMFYDLHNDASLAAQFRASRETVMDRYPLTDHSRAAVLADDIPTLARRSNGFLLRYYFIAAGMADRDFIAGLRQIPLDQ